jgi:hypothetical protein
VANLGFGGQNRDELYMMQEDRITKIKLNTEAPQLPTVIPGNGAAQGSSTAVEPPQSQSSAVSLLHSSSLAVLSWLFIATFSTCSNGMCIFV